MAVSWKQATCAVMLLFLALFFAVGCKPETPPARVSQSAAQLSPIVPPATSTDEPTPPSNDWPTLTPPPTLTPEPTLRETPGSNITLTPSPTRPPLLLTPTPLGTPPSDLQALYYVADNNGTPELRVIGIDKQGRKWSESSVATDREVSNIGSLYPSSDGKYLAMITIYLLTQIILDLRTQSHIQKMKKRSVKSGQCEWMGRISN